MLRCHRGLFGGRERTGARRVTLASGDGPGAEDTATKMTSKGREPLAEAAANQPCCGSGTEKSPEVFSSPQTNHRSNACSLSSAKRIARLSTGLTRQSCRRDRHRDPEAEQDWAGRCSSRIDAETSPFTGEGFWRPQGLSRVIFPVLPVELNMR